MPGRRSRQTDVTVGITADADFDDARKSIAKDLDKIERDAKDTAADIDKAFDKLSPKLDTKDIRRALDLAGQLDGMVAKLDIDADIDDVVQAEKIASSLRRFQGRVDLDVEGREELKEALGLADKLDQIRQVKVQVQGRRDLEQAEQLARDLDQTRTVKVDVDTSELDDAGGNAAAEFLGGFDGNDVGGQALDGIMSGLAVLGPWGAAAGVLGTTFGGDFVDGFSEAWNSGKNDVLRRLNSGLSGADMAEVGEAAGEAWAGGFGEGLGDLKDTAATIASELSALDEEMDLGEVTRQAEALSEVFGIELADSVRLARRLVANELVDDTEQAFNLMAESAQRFGLDFEEIMEVAQEFAPVFGKLGIDGAQAFELMGTMVKEGLLPNIDRTAELFEEFNIRATDGSIRDAIEEIGLSWEDFQTDVAEGRGDEALADTAAALLSIGDEARRNELAVQIFGTSIESAADPERVIELLAIADAEREIGTAASDMADELEKNRSALEEAGRGAQLLGQWLGEALDVSTGAAISLGEALGEVVKGATGFKDATADAIQKARILDAELAMANSGVKDVGESLGVVAGEAASAAGGLDETTRALSGLQTELLGLFDFDADQLMRDIAEAGDDLAASFDEGAASAVGLGGAIDITSTSGRTLQSQMETLNGTMLEAVAQYEAGEITAQELAAAQSAVKTQFDRVTGAADLTGDQVDGLRDKYIALPTDVTTRLNAIDNATRVVDNLRYQLSLLKDKSITVTTRNAVIAATAATAGKRAAGGPVKAGRLYTVGELGEELFVPDEDGQIVNHRDTRQLLADSPSAQSFTRTMTAAPLAAANAGGAPIVIDGSGARGLDALFLGWLRELIETNGGLDRALSRR